MALGPGGSDRPRARAENPLRLFFVDQLLRWLVALERDCGVHSFELFAQGCGKAWPVLAAEDTICDDAWRSGGDVGLRATVGEARRRADAGIRQASAMLAEISAYRLDFLATLRGFEQAMAAEPNDGFVLWKALNNFPWLGDAVKSLSLAERYIALDPLNPAAYNERGSRLYVLRLYADAIDAFNKALAVAPQRYSHG